MLRTSENETEILLGNKQLLGIFFLLAVLLGIAFTGGYMLGRGSGQKKPAAIATTGTTPASSPADGTGGETHAVTPQDSANTGSGDDGSGTDATARQTSPPQETPLGAPKHKNAETAKLPDTQALNRPVELSPASFVPQAGQEFLQVAAVPRADAETIANTLRSQGFRSHAVPTPNNANLYRVIVGPIRDAGDLATTRDSLRKTGFRDVIVQRYR